MACRFFTTFVVFGFGCSLLVAAPLPKPRPSTVRDPDVIFKGGKYERFDGGLVLVIVQSDVGPLSFSAEVPGSKITHGFDLCLAADDFWVAQVETRERIWVYGGGKMWEVILKDGGKTVEPHSSKGAEILEKAPKGILAELPEAEKDRLAGK